MRFYSNLKKVYLHIKSLVTKSKIMRLRHYRNKKEYILHQKQKTQDIERQNKWLNEEWESKLNGFKELFSRHKDIINSSSSALCLGARTGQEVQALLDMGIENVIGVDLVAFLPLVEEGDVHNLRFEDSSFDFAFSNIFDHLLEPLKMFQEVSRVLKSGGYFILHLTVGADIDEYSTQMVRDVKAVEDLLRESFLIISSCEIQNSFDHMNWEIVVQKA